MQKIDITINNRTYKIACDGEQRDHIRQLSEEIDMRARLIANDMPQTHESNILMMTCLHLADELYETRQEAGKLHEKILYDTHDLHEVLPAADGPALSLEKRDAVDKMMDSLADSLEDLSEKIEQL